MHDAGVEVEWRTTLASFEADGSSVRGRLKHGDGTEEPVAARFLVGCDGAGVAWDLPKDRVQLFLSNRSIGNFDL